MSQYSNPQTATKLETAASQGGKSSESVHPNQFNGSSQETHNPKTGAVTAGHSSKIGKVG
jgi:hypothetical protein